MFGDGGDSPNILFLEQKTPAYGWGIFNRRVPMFSEREIQEFIWAKEDDWITLIDPPSLPSLHQFADDLSDLTVETLLHNRLVRRVSALFDKLQSVRLFGIEVPLERSGDSTTRIDLLGSAPDDTGIAIIELKKSRQTEREALTELLAYSQHLSGLFPSLCREDLLLVLISPMETRIVRDAFVQALVFDQKPIVALQPVLTDSTQLATLRLRPWFPDLATVRRIARAAFSPDNFNVCKLVWEDSPRLWNRSEEGSPPSHVKEAFDRVSALAAQMMEAEGIHGFCFTSRTWPEIPFPYPNSLILVGWNPYSVCASLNASEAGVPDQDLSLWSETLADLIPGLLKRAADRHEDHDFLESLRLVWDSHLFRIGSEVLKLTTSTTQQAMLGTDYGFFTWRQYQLIMIEDVTCHNFQHRTTGLMRELYCDLMEIDYNLVRRRGVSNHPTHSDIYHDAVEMLNSQHFVRKFLERLFAKANDL